MKQVLLVAGLVALATGLASCQVLGQTEARPDELTPESPSKVTSPAARSLPEEPTTTFAEVTTPPPSPTPSTPTATPTATPTPMPPSAAIRPAVDGLSQKLAAFRVALSSKDLDRLSSAQLALLDEADKAEQSLKGDRSRQADLVREAIDDVRTGASGQTQLLDAAARLLRQASGAHPEGGTATPSALLGRSTGADLPTLANNLRERVSSYQQARRERNPENLLRRQKDLVDTLSQVEQVAEGDNSPEALQLRSAADALRQALDRGGEGLAGALAQVQVAAGGVGSEQDGQADLRAQAESLQRKASAFKAALAGGSRDDLARLQKDLLDEIGRVETGVRGDQSKTAETVRAALAGIRDGASGDTAKLDGALSKLAQVTGAADGGSAIGSGVQPTDVHRTAEALQDKVDALRRAHQSNNTGDQLRLQRELYDQVAKTEPGLQGISSEQADALRSAIEAIKNGLAGDQRKFEEAERQLRAATGKKPAGAATSAQPQANVDLGPVTSSLENRLRGLEEALQRKDPDAVARAQQDLRAEAERAADALRGVQSPKAERLGAAITAAREAASGDQAKVQVAREMLKQADQ